MTSKKLPAVIPIFLSLMLIAPPSLARGGHGGRAGGGFSGRAGGGHAVRAGGGFSGRAGGGHAGRTGGRIQHSARSGGFGGRTGGFQNTNRGQYGGHGGGFNSIASRPSHGYGGGNRPGYGGGYGGIGNRPGNSTHPINRENLNNQANGIRNSFNRYNNINVNHFGGSYGHYGGHGGRWWGQPGSWYMPGWAQATMWTCAGITAVSSLVGLATNVIPRKTDYGTDVVYQGDTVIINGNPESSAQEYYNQAQQLAYSASNNSIQDMDMAQQDWQPLGVFALAPEGQAESNMIFQLAINKNGIIGGNYFNQITNESYPVSGKLDKDSQRVSWSFGENSPTVFDTSLGNLMENESSCLIHYSADNTQQMALVRLPDPNNSDNQPVSQ